MLYIVSTPIWNLEDITFRAVRTLKEVDCIACEDTRTSGVLLKHYDISKPLLSFHSHSGKAKTDKILKALEEWKDIALISDAGTPWISDPWYALVRDAIAAGHEVCPIPWVTAAVTAISASGMPINHFLYLGFLPLKKWRQTLLTRLSENKQETIVIYESVHRIEKTLNDLEKYFWTEHKIVIGRELTKKFEEFIRGSVEDALKYFKENPGKLKGEFVILF